jgi:hypothetical protein
MTTSARPPDDRLSRHPDDEGIDGWRAVPVRCRFCGHRHWSVHPVGTDERALECPSCHLMAAEVTGEEAVRE